MQRIEGYPNYLITTEGHIYSDRTGVRSLLKPRIDNHGYLRVGLYNEQGRASKLVHRLVAEAFIPNPKSHPLVNHLDGNKRNPRVGNLEWATHQGNSVHAVEEGLSRPHQTRQVAKLCPDTGVCLQVYASCAEAAKDTPGATYQNIWKVASNYRRTAGGFRWAFV